MSLTVDNAPLPVGHAIVGENSALAGIRIALAEECPVCQYNLEGLPLRYTCPECGFEYEPDMLVFGRLSRRSFQRFVRHMSWFFIYVIALVAWTGYAAVDGDLGTVGPIALMGLFTVIVAAFRMDSWVIVRSEGIQWQNGRPGIRDIPWDDVTQVKLSQSRMIVVRCKQRWWGEPFTALMNNGKTIRVREAILADLRKRWIAALTRKGVASEVPLMRDSDADVFRDQYGVKVNGHCPACPGRMRREGHAALVCDRCLSAYRAGAVALRFVDRPTAPWHPFVLSLLIVIAFPVTGAMVDIGYRFSTGLGACVSVVLLILAAMTWNYFRYRRPHLLVVNELGVRWDNGKMDGEQVPWESIESVRCPSGANVVCVRLTNLDLKLIPGEFFRDRAKATEFAGFLSHLRSKVG